jgi:hypothetical protein
MDEQITATVSTLPERYVIEGEVFDEDWGDFTVLNTDADGHGTADPDGRLSSLLRRLEGRLVRVTIEVLGEQRPPG